MIQMNWWILSREVSIISAMAVRIWILQTLINCSTAGSK